MVTSIRTDRPLSRRRLFGVLGATAVGVALMFGYPTSTGSGTARAGVTATAAGGSGGGGGTSGTSSTTTAAGATTYTGDVVQTQWGPVQVAITVSGGKITAAQAVQTPSGNMRDVEINSYAVPQLNAEVVQAQSAQIDTVSGATVTSDGYLQSLQAAVDAAKL